MRLEVKSVSGSTWAACRIELSHGRISPILRLSIGAPSWCRNLGLLSSICTPLSVLIRAFGGLKRQEALGRDDVVISLFHS